MYNKAIPGMYNNKGFCTAFLVFILAKELSFHLVPNIGVDAYKEQGDSVLHSFGSCVHQYKVATVPEEKPLLLFFLVDEHKLALLSVLVVIPFPQEEFGCGGIMTPLLYFSSEVFLVIVAVFAGTYCSCNVTS